MSVAIYNVSNCARINVSGLFRPFIEAEASTSKAVKPGKEQADSDSSSDSGSESDDDEKTGETVFKSPEQVDSNFCSLKEFCSCLESEKESMTSYETACNCKVPEGFEPESEYGR